MVVGDSRGHMLQLNPPIPLSTPHGPGLAHIVIDYGAEHNLIWVTADDATGQVWCWPNSQVRFQKNITAGRPNPEILNSQHGAGVAGNGRAEALISAFAR